MATHSRPRLATAAALVGLTLAGTAAFLRGFLPLKPFLPGWTDASQPSQPPPFDRLAFVLVDALRSDFAFGPSSEMAFLASQVHVPSIPTPTIESGHAIPLTALASPPTVTLPRLKAITTGSNPTFLDAILNIAEDSSTAVLENVDSWVRQLAVGDGDEQGRASAKRVVFVGDDTWLRLFPVRWFEWAEGVSSFFVSDTTTVDTNVTRHLNALLADAGHTSSTGAPPSDWDTLILHYLGMDHVGHLGGPNSRLMKPKQREMDRVYERLFTRLGERDQIEGRNSLIVLVGDHGMSELGNHGGSSEGEVSAALLFAAPSAEPIAAVAPHAHKSPYRFHEVVQQIDLVPTLSVLLGLGIPTNSMAKLIESVVSRWSPEPLKDLLSRNAAQLRRVLEAASPQASVELNFATADSATAAELTHYLDLAQEKLRTTFGDYHLMPMSIGLALLAAACAGFARQVWPLLSAEASWTKRFVLPALAIYLGTFFATSFIEEEHEFWFFATCTGLVLFSTQSNLSAVQRAALLVAAASVRIERGWSFNGQKDLPNASLSRLLLTQPKALGLVTAGLYILSASMPFYILFRASQPHNRPQGASVVGMFLRALSFALLLTGTLLQLVLVIGLQAGGRGLKIGQLVMGRVELARMVYALGGATWAGARIARACEEKRATHLEVIQQGAVVLTLVSLSRPANVPLFALLWAQYGVLVLLRESLSPLTTTSIIIALQQSSYYAFGGSNSLATVDLSSAYNGIASYQVHLVGILTFLSNFGGPFFWACAGPSLLPSPPVATNGGTSPKRAYLLYTTVFHTLALATLAASATHFRRHLFTWTVFSPALVFKCVWWGFVQLGAGVVIGSIQ